MLQGNPYETELWVQERTQMVQGVMTQLRLPWTARAIDKLQGWRPPRMNQGRWKVQGWWLPAAFALGTLLGLIIR